MADTLLRANPPAVRILRDDGADAVRGILLVVFAYLIMTAGDVTAKWMLPAVGVGGIMLWRGVFGALTVFAVAASSDEPGPASRAIGWQRLIPVRPRMVALRSLCGVFSSFAWYVAWRSMSLADTYAVGFTAPLLMTLLAIPILGERIRWRRALSTAVGFGGVLIMVRPGGDLWTPVVAFLMLGICAMAINRIMTRQLSTTETPECLAFWLLAGHIPAGIALLLTIFPAASAPAASGWLALAFLGAANGIAHCLHARAYGLAPVSALAPNEYTMLLWGGLLGYMVFGDVPSWTTLAGASIVAAAGLYNLHRERLRAAQARADAKLA